MFILDRIDRELHSLEHLELKFGLSSEFFDKYLLESFLITYKLKLKFCAKVKE